jgi:hypothetical protein
MRPTRSAASTHRQHATQPAAATPLTPRCNCTSRSWNAPAAMASPILEGGRAGGRGCVLLRGERCFRAGGAAAWGRGGCFEGSGRRGGVWPARVWLLRQGLAGAAWFGGAFGGAPHLCTTTSITSFALYFSLRDTTVNNTFGGEGRGREKGGRVGGW